MVSSVNSQAPVPAPAPVAPRKVEAVRPQPTGEDQRKNGQVKDKAPPVQEQPSQVTNLQGQAIGKLLNVKA